MRRQSRTKERESRDTKHDEGKAAIFDEITQRHDEQQARAVADLRQCDDQPRRLRRKAQRGADRSGGRLFVAAGTGKLAARLTRGVFRFVGGKLSKQENAVTMQTPSASRR